MQGVIKINVDRAFSNKLHLSSVGVVARDAHGIVLGGLAMKIDPPFTTESTEATTFSQCDAISIVYRLSNQTPNKTEDISTVRLLLNEARSLLADFPSFKVLYVSRETNIVVHTLAQWTLSNHNPIWFFLDEPDCIKQLVIDDVIGI
ncbi:uncharacterized protein LOC120174957 [Hibiscus syriacus]|uniref:uncharacterized protein LOC120174957 n=1 Tax=Hibiscus syriacus TaxID=106335 RepID=UPI0019250B1E|nr:uncharacterized protein LOC120174957 [Hibiscus syriacus]